MKKLLPHLTTGLAAAFLLVPTLPLAAQQAQIELAAVDVTPNLLTIYPQAEFGEVKVAISGPESFEVTRTFSSDQSISIDLPSRDGFYKYELRFSPILDAEARRQLDKARQNGTPAPKLDLGTRTIWGSFSVAEGSVVSPALEPLRDPSTLPKEKAQIISPDGVVYNSLCVGFDCPNSPSFGSDTIRMQENNLRIHAQDTSAGSYPTTDWRLEFNSNLNGGGNWFRVQDASANRNIMTVEANAPNHSLYVENSGEVGIGTANPVVELHAVSGDSPALRLEQDTSSGFGAQVWDLAGNETSLFFRDATNGSTLPFRIQPGASSNVLFIASDDDVGFGTTSPEEEIHVVGAENPRILVEDTTDNANDKPGLVLRSPAAASGGDWRFETDNSGNFQIDFGPSAGPELLISDSTASNGTVTINGNLMVNGTCTGCDAVFQPGFELESVEQHAEYMYANSHLPAVGPTPEGKGLINVFAKTTGILQELEKAHIYIADLHRTVKEKDGELSDLAQRVAQLEALIEQLRQQP